MPAQTFSVHKSSRPLWARLTVWVYFILLILVLGFAGFLWKSGELLVRSDSFDHVRWAVMLAGEGADMARSDASLALFQQGRFDSLILSGPRVYRTHHESEFASEGLISQGFPKDRIFQLPLEGGATLYEAATIIRQARLLGVDTLLVITSNYHSARAGRIFEKLAQGSPHIVVYAADDPAFNPTAWWSWRESREMWLLEWAKTLNTKWELWNHDALRDVEGPILLEPNPRAANNNVNDSVKVSIKSDSSASNADTGKIQDTIQIPR